MKIKKSQLKQIIKEELDGTLKEADSSGLLRSIWNMLKDEFEDDPENPRRAPRSPEEDPDFEPYVSPELSDEEKEEQRQIQRAEKARVASSARDAYYHGGTYDPTLEEVVREELKKLLNEVSTEEQSEYINTRQECLDKMRKEYPKKEDQGGPPGKEFMQKCMPGGADE